MLTISRTEDLQIELERFPGGGPDSNSPPFALPQKGAPNQVKIMHIA